MDRTFAYPSQQPTDTLWLTAERNKMVALASAMQAVLGVNTVADGLAVTPTVPASLAINVAPGSIYQVEPLDATSYGSLPVDSVHTIVKQGINLDATPLTLVPPSTSGQAVDYLIQAQLSEVDSGNAVLSYFNSSNPTVPWTGPGGLGTAQPTLRSCSVALQAKAGVAATAGTQVTPSADPGWIGLYKVTVANGATTIVSANIAQMPQAPLIGVKLGDMPRYIQSFGWGTCNDAGTANQIIANLSPVPTSPPNFFLVRKMASPNTTAMTVVVGGVTYPLINADGSTITTGQAPGNFLMECAYDGTSYRFMNGVATTSVGSFSGSAGEGITISGSAVVSLNFPSLTDNPTVGNNDIFAYYNNTDAHHRVIKWSEIITAFQASRLPTLLGVQFKTATGTYTPTTGMKSVFVIATAPGGGGGGASGGDLVASGGGGAGQTGFAYLTAAQIGASQAITINAPGLGGSRSGNASANGAPGGTTVFGTFITVNGGQGGLRNGTQANAQGGAGGTGGTSPYGWLVDGGPGQSGTDQGSGNGGHSFWGAGGLGLILATLNAGTGNGFSGGNYGGGGGGGENQGGPAVTGGDGGPGCVAIFEFS